jgi:ferredoxin-NADP reductase
VPLWEPGQTAYVCGSAVFAESLSQLLLQFGFAPGDVRIERFGPTG